MVVMTTANDLIVVFLALEILSIPLYVLAAYDRRRLASQEAGIKYFVLGAFSSAIFLYGIALGLRRHRHHVAHRHRRRSSRTNTLFEQGTLLAGFVLLLVGLGFKVAAVPFHMWTPDVYQGAPTPVTAFMASATKAAGVRRAAAHLRRRVPHVPRPTGSRSVWGLAVLTLVRRQHRRAAADRPEAPARVLVDRARRLRAHRRSRPGTPQGPRGRALLPVRLRVHGDRLVRGRHRARRSSGDDDHRIDEPTAASPVRRPVIGSLLVLFMLAQAGIPLTGGFVAKLDVFSAAAERGRLRARRRSGAVATVIAAFAYLRVALAVATPDAATARSTERVRHRRVDAGTWIVLAITAGVTIVLGIVPAVFVHWAQDATLLTHVITWIR